MKSILLKFDNPSSALELYLSIRLKAKIDGALNELK
jgi:hypothetical protein